MSGTFADALDLENAPLSIVKEHKKVRVFLNICGELQGNLYAMKLVSAHKVSME
jgi:hypothetical protein